MKENRFSECCVIKYLGQWIMSKVVVKVLIWVYKIFSSLQIYATICSLYQIEFS